MLLPVLVWLPKYQRYVFRSVLSKEEKNGFIEMNWMKTDREIYSKYEIAHDLSIFNVIYPSHDLHIRRVVKSVCCFGRKTNI